MTYTEYRKLASRTLAPLPTREDDIHHMVLGMITELGEILDVYKKKFAYGKDIDWVNVKEEIGDFYWYVANFDNIVKISDRDITDIKSAIKNNEFEDILHALSHVMNAHTDMLYIITNVHAASDLVMNFCIQHKFDVFAILETNIKKLQARYPDKFTKDKAINRDLEKERKILEN